MIACGKMTTLLLTKVALWFLARKCKAPGEGCKNAGDYSVLLTWKLALELAKACANTPEVIEYALR
jgi:hypothetical protein